MLCNLLFLSAPYIIFYHFATTRAPYTVKKVFTASTNKADYPSWVEEKINEADAEALEFNSYE